MANGPVDHNAANLSEQDAIHSVVVLKALRMLLRAVEEAIKALPYKGADLTLALRHVEDARMRCGKSMFPFDTGFVQTDMPDADALSAIDTVVNAEGAKEKSGTYVARA